MKRFVPYFIVAAVIAAALASPNPASAQGRAVARPATRATGQAVARPAYGYPAYRPAYRYGYPYYGYRYGYPYYGYPYYGYPYYGSSFAFGIGIGFGFGWGYPYYGHGYPFYYGAYGYPYGPYPYPYGYAYDNRGAARLEVRPREAEVFVDGYFVGDVDNFDGWAQRLYIAPGEHQLTIYLKGHHTYRQNLLFRPGSTLRLEHVMQPLGPGEVEEPRPEPPAQPRRDPRDYPPPRDYPQRDYPPQDDQRQPGEPVPSPRRGTGQSLSVQSDLYGSLAVRVQPLDAEVFVDGEAWQSPEAGSITLQLSEGVHRVEVRKQGYRTYSAEVRVRRGDSTSVNVSLSRE